MTILTTAWGSTGDRRRHAGFAIALTMAILVAASGQASAQAPYPNRPIRLIVPYPPGAGTDFTAREVGAQFSKALGQPVVIDNRPGAAATIGHALAAKSPPDGYTLLLGTTGGLVSGPALMGSKIPYDPLKDFATDRPGDVCAVRARGDCEPAREQRQRADRSRASFAAQAQRRIAGCRDAQSPGRGATDDPHRHRARSRALQGQLARADRSSRRQRAAPDHGAAATAAAPPRGTAQDPRRRPSAAAQGVSGHSDHRGNSAGLLQHRLVGHRRAGRHARKRSSTDSTRS